MWYMTFKDELLSSIDYAIKNNYDLFAVRIFFEDSGCYETIINTAENFKDKKEYYSKTYDKDLIHKNANHIKIIDFCYANSYSDIEASFDY